MNDFMKRIYYDIQTFNKAHNKKILVAMAPSVYPWSKNEYLQDWPTWLSNGWAD